MSKEPKREPSGPATEKKSQDSQAKSSSDVVLVHGVTEDKKGLKVLRAREEGIEAGEVRPLEEGKSITGDLVRLKPRAGAPYLCDVETELSLSRESSSQASQSTRGRPAQVATANYRDNWDAIFSQRTSAPGSSDLN